MKIGTMFEKEITRNLDGVIVVGDKEKGNVKQELEEYVVTKELLRHFREFFSNYKQGIVGSTTKTGVWISGFFGSGKSHFLKILSYLLGDKVVDGKHALQYLVDNDQIKDPVLLGDMQLAADTPTDVVLFNIDSKSDQAGKQNKNSIVMVFLKVFNDMQGFYGSIPCVADLERQLTKEGRYEEFQEIFEKTCGESWKASRNEFYYIQDDIVNALVEMGYMSEPAARNWCAKATEPYQISIEDFAKMVHTYLDGKGKNHHIAFLVDEVGQYIGDNSQLMLNLQTLREELGKECQGRAWVIVTSQQDIDSITQVKGNDFSKIQGRFDTRISLSSANVDEVIKERILKKTPTAAQTLRLMYEQKSTQLSNILLFENTAEMKLYADADEYVRVYPFIPYQFQLLASALTSIRIHSASGKHLSEGERSMLALFKESAATDRERDETALMPFYMFYDPLEKFLDSSHSRVIRQAYANSHINPDGSTECFAVNVLKCLFLIKYVKEFEHATLENITTLMISHVDEDRALLTQKVEDALRVLIHETLVQKHNNIYVFLTEEEQEIGHSIDQINVEMSAVIAEISEIIFEKIFTDKRYRYPKFNGRYTFPFNQKVDDHPYKSTREYDIGVHILTPYADVPMDETSLRLRSGQGREVLLVMPEDVSYLDETRQALKIDSYLYKNSSSMPERYEEIKNKKRGEMRDCLENAERYLRDALRNAVIYVNGDRAQIPAKEVNSRIGDALLRLVETVYHKLYYIEAAFGEDEIRKLLTKSNQISLDLGDSGEANKKAQADVLAFIAQNTSMHMKSSLKTLKDKFTKAPYGFVEDDVEWLVTRLFVKGDITLTLNGSPVTRQNKSTEELFRLLTKREFAEKLLSEYRVRRSAGEIRCAVELVKDLFHVTAVSDEEDSLMQLFQRYGENLVHDLNNMLQYDYQKPYPGKDIVSDGVALLRPLLQMSVPAEFYPRLVKDQDALKDFAEDYEPIKAFFGGEQKKIFDQALRLMQIYDDSKSYIVNRELESVVASIRDILRNKKPYKDIPKLPALLDEFRKIYTKVMDEAEAPVLSAIDQEMTRVLEVLDTKPYREQYHTDFCAQFQALREGAQHCSNVTLLRSFADQACAVKLRLLNQMDAKDAELSRAKAEEERKKAEEQGKAGDAGQSGGIASVKEEPAPYHVKRKKNLAIKSITQTSSWWIESQDDIDSYVEKLRDRLRKELSEGDILNIEF